MDRSLLIDGFLRSVGWIGATRRMLAGDASFRRYERIKFKNKTAILMDAPPPAEDVRPFIKITKHLASLGYSVPRIMCQDIDAGFLLLEDLGDKTYSNALTAGVEEKRLYQSAVDVLIDLHSLEASEAVPIEIESYDNEKLLAEANFFVDWYMAGILGNTVSKDARNDFQDIWYKLLLSIKIRAKTLVLRDFHADNLIWLPNRPGIRKCGLLDYQDAVSGFHAYDLMSLLEDARRDLRPGLDSELLDYYYEALPDFDRNEFDKVYSILSAQRHCKVIGIFSRLAIRDGKTGYLSHIPRCWGLLERACCSPELQILKEWLDVYIPMQNRTSQI
ncbi:phosphotransferase [Gammaproteobacteria bacterium]|nr:phosphotransferase [Gammaproteobacteria bacterium]